MTHTRTTSPHALEAHVRAVAADRRIWEPHHSLDSEHRVSVRLGVEGDVETWVISWMPGHDTGFHDHGASAGAFCIARGTLVEDLLTLRDTPDSRRLPAGASASFTSAHVHRVRNPGPAPAVSVHAYSPPLTALGAYLIGPGGRLQREPWASDRELVSLSA